MNKAFIIASAVLGIAVAGALTVAGWKVFRITDPYLVEPVTTLPAQNGAKTGHSIEGVTRVLSVVSSNRIIVVADPGVSFHYQVLWLVEKPRKDGSHTLMEYKCKLPKYVSADHLHPIGSEVPSRIQEIAEASQWR
jgi:hypothetical protein